MAKKTVEEIAFAEETAEKQIEAAKKKADDIIKSAAESSKQAEEEILKSAHKRAHNIIDASKAQAEEKLLNAKLEAIKDCDRLKNCYETSSENAVKAVISLISQ